MKLPSKCPRVGPSGTSRHGSQDLEAQVAALSARVEEGAVLHQRFAELPRRRHRAAAAAPTRPRSQQYVDELGSEAHR